MSVENVRRIRGRGRLTAVNRLRDVVFADVQSIEHKRAVGVISATHSIATQ